MRHLIAATVLLLAVGPAAAQSRDPGHRQTLTDLSRVLGESHALRQACAGPGDQFWRARMLRLLEVERPGPGLEQALKDAFNDGYAGRRRDFPVCTPAARRAEAAAGARGRALAGRLSQAVRTVPPEDPDAMAQDAPAR